MRSENVTDKLFCSKILLFGEYSIIKDSMALAVPYTLFEGRLTFPSEVRPSANAIESNKELRAFHQYLKDLGRQGQLPTQFDLSSFEFDLHQGLYFDSTIPQGFGVGSSGALCAAFFHRYFEGKSSLDNKVEIEHEDILKLKHIFSLIEGHFHGASSGVDPLISYLARPILIESKAKLGPVNIPDLPEGRGAIFLLNTGRPRRTEPLVNLFLEKCKRENFNTLCEGELRRINNDCIVSFLESDRKALLSHATRLSEFQFEHLLPMIPPLYRELWDQGLSSDDYVLKLCGAGGGGFLLGFTPDLQKAKAALKGHQIRTVFKL